jgi:hypothetical protein
MLGIKVCDIPNNYMSIESFFNVDTEYFQGFAFLAYDELLKNSSNLLLPCSC